MSKLTLSPLGKKTAYVDQYDASLIYPIARTEKRSEIGVASELPFKGYDEWNAFEISWLDTLGKPIVVIARFIIPCESPYLIESKSFKLYLNSFNNSHYDSELSVVAILKKDLSAAAGACVDVQILHLTDYDVIGFEELPGESIDGQAIKIETYSVYPKFLKADDAHVVSETLTSHLLKSNCLVTGQPDWGSVRITYTGPKICKEGLLRYVVSFRNHNEFHEQCVERMFMDIMSFCRPVELTVEARYTRRGGLDINPIRSTQPITFPEKVIRNIRQ